jgi:hypothetical protein
MFGGESWCPSSNQWKWGKLTTPGVKLQKYRGDWQKHLVFHMHNWNKSEGLRCYDKKCLTHVWIYVWISYNQVIINIIRNLKGTYITIWRELCRAFSQFASKMLHWPWPLRSKAQGIHGTMASMMESWKKQDTFANHPSELGKPCWDFWVPWVP